MTTAKKKRGKTTLTAENLEYRIRQLYQSGGLPMRFFHTKLSDFKSFGCNKKEREFNQKGLKKFEEFATNLEDKLEEGRSLAICGGAGLGKTKMLCYLAREIIERDIHSILATGATTVQHFLTLRFVLSSELSDLIFTNKKEDQKKRSELFSADVLFIDDITKIAQFKQGHELVFLDRILRTRYHNLLPTFLTSQFPFDKLNEALSEPIMDLLYEMAESIVLIGDSWRRK